MPFSGFISNKPNKINLPDLNTHLADYVKHIYRASLALNTDFNTVIDQGIYDVGTIASMTNKPTGIDMSYSTLEVWVNSYVTQKLYNPIYGESYFRVRNQASTWSLWARVLTDTNFGLGSRVYHTLNQSVANNTPTVLAFNSEVFNDSGMHNLAGDNSKLTCIAAGKYLIEANIYFDNNATGLREIDILVNGSPVATTQESAISGGGKASIISATLKLAVGDYVQMRVSQGSGSSLNIIANGFSPYFSAVRVGA